jgi:chlorophyll(ide) b reductase
VHPGVSGSFKSFLDGSPEDLAMVTRTNLLGALLCTRAAINVMEKQARVGHVFNMDGAGTVVSPVRQLEEHFHTSLYTDR